MKALTAVALVGATLFSAPAYAHEGWVEDFDKAVAIAKEQKKDLFVDFTGSDWCGWCIKLNEEVFDHDVFRESIKENYILVSLDFPNGEEAKAAVPNPERNKELQAKYGIRGFPTILLMNTDGVVYGQTGYQAGGPEAYLKHVEELRTTGRKDLEMVQAVMKEYEAADEAGKIAAVGKVIDSLVALPEGSPFADMLIEPAKTALTLDPKNEAGLKLRAVKGLSKSGIYFADLLIAAKELDAENAQGVLEIVVRAQFGMVRDGEAAKAALESLDALNAKKFTDKTIGFSLNFTAATWANGPMQNPELAKAYALRAKEFGSDDPKLLEALNELIGGNAN